MRTFTFVFLTCICFCLTKLNAQTDHFYGYAPLTPNQEEIAAHGSGKNNFTEAMIALDPSSDPMLQRLKGSKIVGVRCYLRADYNQASKRQSLIRLYQNELKSTPIDKPVNFKMGWNEVYFDEPVEITDSRIYVGFQVFETKGTPYPLAAYSPISVANSFYTNIARKGWNEYKDRGTLLIQAIIRADNKLFDNVAAAHACNFPQIVAPEQNFQCDLYVHNASSHPISSVEVESVGGAEGTPLRQTFTFDAPIKAYESAILPAEFVSSPTEGVAEPVTLRVTQVDGKDCPETMTSFFNLYVSEDVFRRIPLIEEFTGLRCPNCPLMAYYLDIALENYKAPYVYVAHHAGFLNDMFTTEVDNELLYLFGEGSTFNPAIMYDRTVLKGDLIPIKGITDMSPEPYLSALNEVKHYPAQAKVLVDVNKEGKNLTCRVHGKVSKSMLQTGEDFYLSTYIIEDKLPEERYPQQGLDVEDAPADLKDRFMHNGVIRKNLCTNVCGDKLIVNEDATYSVEYTFSNIPNEWIWDNCQVVAFVHKNNRNDLRDNIVLNAGSNKLNDAASGIIDYTTSHDIIVFVNQDRKIETSEPVRELTIYSICGTRRGRHDVLVPGFYVIRFVDCDGNTHTRKLFVE